jgi:hypothetical protein
MSVISNNDMLHLHRRFTGKSLDCLGFSVNGHGNQHGKAVARPALVGLKGGTHGANIH